MWRLIGWQINKCKWKIRNLKHTARGLQKKPISPKGTPWRHNNTQREQVIWCHEIQEILNAVLKTVYMQDHCILGPGSDIHPTQLALTSLAKKPEVSSERNRTKSGDTKTSRVYAGPFQEKKVFFTCQQICPILPLPVQTSPGLTSPSDQRFRGEKVNHLS